jgi:hypothetical protein
MQLKQVKNGTERAKKMCKMFFSTQHTITKYEAEKLFYSMSSPWYLKFVSYGFLWTTGSTL